ncbi:MAG: hypothetical protein LBK71_00635 [Verrucomicrobiales bacterium]|nr:hypothetical protein [Verrucomicrobiales bacterium]
MRFPDGATWAIGNGRLFEYADGQWQKKDWSAGVFAANQAGGLRDAAAGAGNGVWLLTESEGKKFIVKWNRMARRAEFAKELPFEKSRFYKIRLHPAPDGSLWVTADDPRVMRLADGEWQEQFRADDTMRLKSLPAGKADEWHALDLTFDADGAAWVWTAPWIDWGMEEGSLNGVVRVKDGQGQWFGNIEGLPKIRSQAINFVTVSGRDELWLTLYQRGTFRLRLGADTVTAIPLEFPDDTKVNPVWEAFTISGTVWAVNGRGGFSMGEIGDTNGALWRMNAGGDWQKIITGPDYNGDALRALERPRLVVDGGFWLASNGRGLWWIPADGEPVNLDWRKGFPVSHPLSIRRDAAGRLTVASERGAWSFDTARALSLTAAPTSSRLAFLTWPLARAGNGDLFCVTYKTPRQWSPDGWRDLPLPEDEQQRITKSEASMCVTTDSRNRVWFIPFFYPEREKNSAYVWNIDTQTWDVPRNYLELIAEAAKTKPDWHFLFATKEVGGGNRDAVFDRHGRAAFIGSYRVLWLFDGQQWRQLNTKEFQAPENAWFNEVQNRAADGDILVLVDKKWWRLAEDGHWELLAESEYPQRRKSLLTFATADGDEWLLKNNVGSSLD